MPDATNIPNVNCRSRYFEIKSFPISISYSFCSCNITRELYRCQVFNLLDKENELSAEAFVDGLTRSITTRDTIESTDTCFKISRVRMHN